MSLKSLVCGLIFLAMHSSSVADTLTGTVQDDQGRPIVGARVDVATAAPKVGRGIFCPSCYLDCKKSVRSDENGRFEIRDLDPKLKFRLLSTAPGRQTRQTDLLDPAKDTATVVLPDLPPGLSPMRMIAGVVETAEGTPVAGALLDPFGHKTATMSSFGRVQANPAVSDDQGRFLMLLDADYEEVFVSVTADELAGATLTLKPAEASRIVVPVGTTVTGRLVHDGRPQANRQIAIVQTNRRSGTHFIKAVQAVTDREGRFAFQALPASQQYCLFTPVGSGNGEIDLKGDELVLSTKTFEARGDGEKRDLGTLELTPGMAFSGRLIFPAGGSRPEDLKLSLGRDPAWDLIEVPVDAEGRFSIWSLPPETYQVHIVAPGLRPDLARMKFQGLRSNAFGVRLTESLRDVEIPLISDDPVAPQAPEPSKEAKKTQTTPTDRDTDEPVVAVRPPVQLRDEPVVANGPKLNVRGQIVTPDGKAIPGTDVMLRSDLIGTLYAISPRHYGDILGRTKSDSKGRFVFDNVPTPPRLTRIVSTLAEGKGGARVLASHPGRGLNFAEVRELDNSQPLQIVLGPAATISGKIVGDAGQPISEARVEITTIAPIGPSLKEYQQTAEQTHLSMSEFDHSARSDADGNFVLRDLPTDRIILVQVEAPGFEGKRVAFSTVSGDQSLPYSSISYGQLPVPLLQAPAAIALKPVAHVTIQVNDEHGSPVPDGTVRILETNRRSGSNQIALDAGGRAIVPIKNSGTYTVTYSGEPLHPRLSMNLIRELSVEQANLPISIQLPPARWLTGSVVSAETGQPVVGAWVRFIQRETKEPASATGISDANGEFRLPVVPGPGRLSFVLPIHGFYASPYGALQPDPPGTDVVVPPDGDVPRVKLIFSPGLVIHGTVVDQNRSPLSNVIVRATAVERNFNPIVTRSNTRGEFQLAGLPANAAVHVTVTGGGASAEQTIPAAELKADEMRHERLELVLRPGIQIIGRALKEGRPQSGVHVHLKRQTGSDRFPRPFAEVTTDEDGRYAIGGLDPGDGYQLDIFTDDGWLSLGAPNQSPIAQKIPSDHTGPLELPDTNLVRCRQILAGRVVDHTGKPVVGVRISAALATPTGWSNIPYRQNTPSPVVQTDNEGRFRLEQLPEQPIRLMGYIQPIKTPAVPSPIKFPLELQPALNDTAIEIVFDPRLAEPIDSLDQR